MLTATAIKENGYMSGSSKPNYPSFSRQIIIIVGGFGSGKTEVSVNLAKFLTISYKNPVTIVDLDLVNPYFRSREAVSELEKLGVRAIAPSGEQFHADLPILLPEVKGAIENINGFIILDVGGDSQGTKALGSLNVNDKTKNYEMLFVVNSRRPATADVETSLATMQRIEYTSKLKFAGLISNSHLIDETDHAIIKEGFDLVNSLGKKTGLPIKFISVKENLLKNSDIDKLNCPILPLTRSMLKPWERGTK
ncbi:MAG: cobalamin biosynthesis protein CbiA [candidate division Zixibacteria bacterium]|nr:cobalamin biosynthesis protein CbiA [candidate division Zixibacteria bacterium]